MNLASFIISYNITQFTKVPIQTISFHGAYNIFIIYSVITLFDFIKAFDKLRSNEYIN